MEDLISGYYFFKPTIPKGPPPDFHCAWLSDLLGIDLRLFIDIVYNNTMD